MIFLPQKQTTKVCIQNTIFFCNRIFKTICEINIWSRNNGWITGLSLSQKVFRYKWFRLAERWVKERKKQKNIPCPRDKGCFCAARREEHVDGYPGLSANKWNYMKTPKHVPLKKYHLESRGEKAAASTARGSRPQRWRRGKGPLTLPSLGTVQYTLPRNTTTVRFWSEPVQGRRHRVPG